MEEILQKQIVLRKKIEQQKKKNPSFPLTYSNMNQWLLILPEIEELTQEEIKDAMLAANYQI